MKKILVEVKDGTNVVMAEPITLHHMSDLGEGVKEVVEDFVKSNGGAVLPPVSITAVEQPASGVKEYRKKRQQEGASGDGVTQASD
jgi:hypothetical protein